MISLGQNYLYFQKENCRHSLSTSAFLLYKILLQLYYFLKADCLSLLYLAGYSMYSALKVAMAADQSNNIASTWKKMYSSQGEENYDQSVFVEDIEDNEEGAIGEFSVSIKMKVSC